jgi:two-component sensor histidine kinase
MFGRTIHVHDEVVVVHELPESESIPIALTLNELLTNAIKHGDGGDLRCTLGLLGEGVVLRIAGPGTLPPGFELTRHRSAVAGLGLVRALLPRRSATFTLSQEGADVVSQIELRPPSVRLPVPLAADR